MIFLKDTKSIVAPRIILNMPLNTEPIEPRRER